MIKVLCILIISAILPITLGENCTDKSLGDECYEACVKYVNEANEICKKRPKLDLCIEDGITGCKRCYIVCRNDPETCLDGIETLGSLIATIQIGIIEYDKRHKGKRSVHDTESNDNLRLYEINDLLTEEYNDKSKKINVGDRYSIENGTDANYTYDIGKMENEVFINEENKENRIKWSEEDKIQNSPYYYDNEDEYGSFLNHTEINSQAFTLMDYIDVDIPPWVPQYQKQKNFTAGFRPNYEDEQQLEYKNLSLWDSVLNSTVDNNKQNVV